jgi:YD repeat-containing protein
MTYVYNTLSQMTSETRTFTGVGSFTLSYPSYNLGGQLTNITNPWGAQVGYNYDKTGRPLNETGAGYAGVTSYVNGISYRWRRRRLPVFSTQVCRYGGCGRNMVCLRLWKQPVVQNR